MDKLESDRNYYTPEEVCRMFGTPGLPDHITYNPNLKRIGEGQYDRIEQSTHDGTLVFTKELLGRVMETIVERTSYYKGFDPIDWGNIKDIHYEVGKISLASVYGKVSLPCSKTQKYHGMKQRARMAVKCTLIY